MVQIWSKRMKNIKSSYSNIILLISDFEHTSRHCWNLFWNSTDICV